MAQQTAVEWLKEQMHDYDHAPVSNNEEYVIIIPVWIFKDKFNTAKQMEKEQIIKAASVVLWNNSSNSTEEAERYYNETYKK